jgi:4-amino-4-deoxy-L-arabinose transferase-like glycosyltransferase
MRKHIDPYLVVLLLLLVGFGLFKLGSLPLAYYWDEAWVYAPAVKAMVEHGPSLSPGALPPELSRGHPVLFHAMAASWMSLWGASRSSAHSFALAISLCVLVVTYLLGVQAGSKRIGLAAVCLLLVNEMFLAQSAILLPEMTMTLFLLGSVLAFLRGHKVAYLLCATAALLTKESALVLMLALFAWHILDLWSKRKTPQWRSAVTWSAVVIAPLALASVFFILQYLERGWFFYPEHLGMMTWSPKDIIYKAKLIFTLAFEEQGQLVLTYSTCLIAPLALRASPRWAGVLSALLLTAAIKVLWGRWEIPLVPTLPAALFCVGLAYFAFSRPIQQLDGTKGRLIGITYLFIVGYWSFSSLNFFSDRYLLCLTPFMAVGASSLLALVSDRIRSWVFPVVITCCAVPMMLSIGKDGRVGDTRLSYADAIRVQSELVSYCENEHLQQEKFHGSFMDRHYMTEPFLGYMSDTLPFWNVADTLNAGTRFAILSNASPSEARPMLESNGFTLTQRFAHGSAWCELHQRDTVMEP